MPGTVVTIGNATLDRIWRVARLPLPGEKIRAQGYLEVGGGQAANAAVAVARLGGRARLVSVVGSDAIGGAIIAGLEVEDVDVAYVARASHARSISSAILVEPSGERVIVGDVDPALHAAAQTVAFDCLDGAGAVLSDVKWPAAEERLLGEARRRGIPTVVDIEPAAPGNQQRLAPLADHAIFGAAGLAAFAETDDPEAGLARAFERLGTVVGVTLGRAGAHFITPAGRLHVPAPPVVAVDTTGAGDAFHGAYALALTDGRGVAEAARFASAVAALKCTKPGGRAGLPTRSEVERLLAGA